MHELNCMFGDSNRVKTAQQALHELRMSDEQESFVAAGAGGNYRRAAVN